MGAQIRSVVDLTPLCCSPKEAAKLTNLSVDVIYHAITAQELPAFEMVIAGKRVNRRLMMVEDLMKWIEDYKVGYCNDSVGDKVVGVEPRDRVHQPSTKRGIRKAKRAANKNEWREKRAQDEKEFKEQIAEMQGR